MNIIVAVDRNWAIGFKGGTLVDIPADRKLFREETMGKVVVMGRKTLESLPGGQPLPGRVNILLSRSRDNFGKGIITCKTLEECLSECAKYPPEDVYVIGGQEIYEAFLPYCDVAHVTWIDYSYEADTYFPNLEKDPEWILAAESEEQTYFDLCYEFRMYCRKSVLKQGVSGEKLIG
ncbi:MAG: dihydrofolate reductase [Lachnospiraceae bacterium]|nr:dihydrofolate reductase [Lachnospiraceae bacterium]